MLSCNPRRLQRAFTLIELLVVIAVIAVLIGLLLPALSRAREAGRNVVCLGNLRSCAALVQAYADDNKGLSPALGRPYTDAPNWAVVVQNLAGVQGTTVGETLTPKSVVVCPSAVAYYGRPLNRAYAINVTGHEGDASGAGGFDDASVTVHINLNKINAGLRPPLFIDSAWVAPPLERTASVISFRVADHVAPAAPGISRIGRWHGKGQFDAAYFDGAASITKDVPDTWREPLP